MKKQSAGILLYRRKDTLEFFMVHYGGPYWVNKDEGSWSIPKGEFDNEEEPFTAALREFKEETGFDLSPNDAIELNPVSQKSGKKIYAWAIEGDIEPSKIRSNEFEIEWPPKSGKMKKFPEVDKGEWFEEGEAKKKINPAQVEFIDELIDKLS